MRYAWSFALLAAALSLGATPPAIPKTTPLTGKVTAVEGPEVRIALDGPLDPQPGDEVTIHFQIPGGPPVRVGTWRVVRVEAATVVATQVEATGVPALDQVATIAALAPRRRPAPASGGDASAGWSAAVSGTARLRYRGREYEARWQRETRAGQTIDNYYWPAPASGGVPAQAGGQPLWNRFVRVPADDAPDQSGATWWFSRWEHVGGQWRQTDTRDEPVELLSRSAGTGQ